MLLSLSRSARVAASVAVLAATFAASAAFASPSIGITSNPANGNILSDDKGMTLRGSGAPNAQVCLHSDPQAFFDFYLGRVAGSANVRK